MCRGYGRDRDRRDDDRLDLTNTTNMSMAVSCIMEYFVGTMQSYATNISLQLIQHIEVAMAEIGSETETADPTAMTVMPVTGGLLQC